MTPLQVSASVIHIHCANGSAGKLKGFFGSASNSEDPSAEPSATDLSAGAVPSPSPSDEKKPQASKDKDQSIISLKVQVAPLSIHPLTLVEKKLSREK